MRIDHGSNFEKMSPHPVYFAGEFGYFCSTGCIFGATPFILDSIDKSSINSEAGWICEEGFSRYFSLDKVSFYKDWFFFRSYQLQN